MNNMKEHMVLYFGVVMNGINEYHHCVGKPTLK